MLKSVSRPFKLVFDQGKRNIMLIGCYKERGQAFSHEEGLPISKFQSHWFGSFAAVMLKGEETQIRDGRDWTTEALGTFYCRPNYPGLFYCHPYSFHTRTYDSCLLQDVARTYVAPASLLQTIPETKVLENYWLKHT